MKSHTYLEAILTINAVLLGGLLWMSAAGTSPTMPAIAVGQDQPMAFPNPDLQREELLRAIRSMSDDMRMMRHDLKTTEFKVRVTSMPKEAGGGAQANPQGKQHSETAVNSEPMIQVTRVTKPTAEDK